MNFSFPETDDQISACIPGICGRDRILFSDIDGTLVTDDKSMTSLNRAALDRFLESGGIFSISTGRALSGASRLMQHLGFQNRQGCYIMAYNGGQIYDAFHGETLMRRGIPSDDVREAVACAMDYGIHIQGYTDSEVIAERIGTDLEQYCSLQHLPPKIVPDIADALEQAGTQTCKLLAIDFRHPERITGFRAYLGSRFEGRLDIFQSNAWLLEIVPHGVSKGNGLRYLADALHISVDRTIAAGDAENDIPMIEAAGTGCAMQNADASLKHIADYVTARDNNSSGIAEILCRFCVSS